MNGAQLACDVSILADGEHPLQKKSWMESLPVADVRSLSPVQLSGGREYRRV